MKLQTFWWKVSDEILEKNGTEDLVITSHGINEDGLHLILKVTGFIPTLTFGFQGSPAKEEHYDGFLAVLKKHLVKWKRSGQDFVQEYDYSKRLHCKDDFIQKLIPFWGFHNKETTYYKIGFDHHKAYQKILYAFKHIVLESRKITAEQAIHLLEEYRHLCASQTQKHQTYEMKYNFKKDTVTRYNLSYDYVKYLMCLEDEALPAFMAHPELFNVVDPVLSFVHQRCLHTSGWSLLHDVEMLSEADNGESNPVYQVLYHNIEKLDDKDIPFSVSPHMKELSFDIETYSNDSNKFPDAKIKDNCVFQIGVTCKTYGSSQISKYILCYNPNYDTVHIELGSDDEVHVKTFRSETELLIAFRDLVLLLDPTFIYGYNTKKFDWIYLLDRATLLGCRDEFAKLSREKDYICQLKEEHSFSKQKGETSSFRLDIPGRFNIDVMLWIQDVFKASHYTLNHIAGELLKEHKYDMPVERMFQAYESQNETELSDVAAYCIQDTLLVQKIVDKMDMLTQLIEMSNISFVPIDFLLNRGQQIKAYSLISQLVIISTPSFAIPYIVVIVGGRYCGAVVLDVFIGLYKTPVATLDFSGLYPSIMMFMNVCYTTWVNNKVLLKQLYEDIFVHQLGEEENTLPDFKSEENLKLFKLTRQGLSYKILTYREKLLIQYDEADHTKVLFEYISIENAVESQSSVSKAQVLEGLKKGHYQWKTSDRFYAICTSREGILPRLQRTLKSLRSSTKKKMAAIKHFTDKDHQLYYRTLNGRQLGHKLTMNCMPSHNHEILTEHGFYTLEQTLKHFETNAFLKIACYVPEQKRIVYAEIDESKILQNEGQHNIITFGNINNKNGVSVDVTDNHRMYVRCGPNWKRSNVPAYQIVSAEQVTKQAQSIGNDAVLQFQARCELGLGSRNCTSLLEMEIFKELEIKTIAEAEAFVQLYGYWLGDGYLDGSKKAVSFSPVKCEDTEYIQKLIAALPTRITENTIVSRFPKKILASDTKSYETWEHPHVINIKDQLFWRFFAENYGHKYEHVNCLSEAVNSNLCNRPKLYKLKEFSNRLLSMSANSITTYNDNCIKANEYRPLHNYSHRVQNNVMLIEGRCYNETVTQMEDAEDTRAQKWFMQWCFMLNQHWTELLLRGLNMADGGGGKNKDIGHICIFTSSEIFSDQVAQLGLHAGYSSIRRINTVKGSFHNCNKKGIPIIAKETSWTVRLTKFATECEPKLSIRDIQHSSYNGTVWCVNVPVAPNLIIVRKFDIIDNVKHTSRPIVISNSLYGFTAAQTLNNKILSKIITTIGRDSLARSKYIMENIFKREAEIMKWSRNDIMAYWDKEGNRISMDDPAFNKSQCHSVYPSAVEGETWAGNDKFNLEVIGGDSVSGDTPVLLRNNCGQIFYREIQDIDDDVWMLKDGKEFKPCRYQVWSDKGFTNVRYIIRHKVTKRMYRIITATGYVDVTEDHSLLTPSGQPIQPSQLSVGDALLHSSLPTMGVYRDDSFDFGFDSILNQPLERRIQCIETLCMSGYQSKLEEAVQLHVAASIHRQFEFDSNGTAKILDPGQIAKNPDSILSIQCLTLNPTEAEPQYVYDLTTESGHFAVGPGCLVVKNTDSIFCHFQHCTLAEAISMAQKAADMVTTILNRAPLTIAYEKTFMPYILQRKKGYVGCKYETKCDQWKVDHTGLATVRRNYAKITQDGLWQIIYAALNLNETGKVKTTEPRNVMDTLVNVLNDFLLKENDMSLFAVTAKMKSEYKNENLPHVQLAKRMEIRDPSSAPQIGHRFQYVVVRDDFREDVLSARTESLYYAQTHNMRLDMLYYLVQQLQNPYLSFLSIIGLHDKAAKVFNKTIHDLEKNERLKQAKAREKSKQIFFLNDQRHPRPVFYDTKPKKRIKYKHDSEQQKITTFLKK